MSQENVEIVRRMFGAYFGAEPEVALAHFHREVEFDVTARPDGRIWHGPDGIRRAMIDWTGAWDRWRMELEDVIDIDDERVLVLWSERGTGKGSGVAMERTGATLLTVRGGSIVRMAFMDRRQALELVGRRE